MLKVNAQKFCERLGIEFAEELVPYYEKGEKLYAENGNKAVDTERLTQINTKYNAYRLHFAEVIKAAELVAEDRDMVVWVYTLIAMMAENAPVKYLPVPDREHADTDFLPLFSFMWYFDDMADAMAKRGVPFEVISDTLHEFEAETNDYFGLYGRRGIRRYVGWFMHFFRGEILRIGRLNFEMTTLSRDIRVYEKDGDIKVLMDDLDMHRSGMVFGSSGQDDEAGRYHAVITETPDSVTGYAANEYGECDPEPITLTGYKEVLRKGDSIISVHIPALDQLTTENCESAYSKDREIFTKCYPEHGYKAFCCFSWMMEKRLRQIMGRDTNITRFADKYTGFPLKSGGSAVNSFLFHVPEKVELSELPEDSSMQRAVKKYLLDGGMFYEKGGVFL